MPCSLVGSFLPSISVTAQCHYLLLEDKEGNEMTLREMGSEDKDVDRDSSAANFCIGNASLQILLLGLNMEVINTSPNSTFKIINVVTSL